MSYVQNWRTAAILVHRIVVKASVPSYKAKEALYAKSVVREDKWTTGECAQHHLAQQKHSRNHLTVKGSGLPESALSFKSRSVGIHVDPCLLD